MTKFANGQKFRVWELPPGRANEALDIRVYGYAALCGLMHMGLKLNRRVEAVQADPTDVLPPAPETRQEVELDVVRRRGRCARMDRSLNRRSLKNALGFGGSPAEA